MPALVSKDCTNVGVCKTTGRNILGWQCQSCHNLAKQRGNSHPRAVLKKRAPSLLSAIERRHKSEFMLQDKYDIVSLIKCDELLLTSHGKDLRNEATQQLEYYYAIYALKQNDALKVQKNGPSVNELKRTLSIPYM